MKNFEQPAAKPVAPDQSWSELLGEELPKELEARSARSSENQEHDALLATWREKKGPLGMGTVGDHTEKGVQKRQREMDAAIASIELPQATEPAQVSLPSFTDAADTDAVSDIRRKLEEHPDSGRQLPGQRAA